MKHEDIIKKWLAGTLGDEEKNLLEKENIDLFDRLDNSMNKMQAPEYNQSSAYAQLSSLRRNQPRARVIYLYPVMGIAAAAIITLLLTFYFIFYQNGQISVHTVASETKEIYLPDSSRVLLNSLSTISYSEDSWKDSRELDLQGEAYFEVRKGSDFVVNGKSWQVAVLGTRFNINSRNNVFIVKCYEGKVRVHSDQQSQELLAGSEFRLVDDQSISSISTSENHPGWTEGRSVYSSMPIAYVIDDIERIYDISITRLNLGAESLFTGFIPSDNLETALKTISLSTGCIYEITDLESVIIKCENP